MAGEAASEIKQLRAIADQLLVVLGTLRLESHQRAQRIVEEISANGEVLSMDRARQENYLRSMAKSHPFIELLYITDDRGQQVTSNISAAANVRGSYGSDGYRMDWSRRPWFRGARDSGGTYLSDLYLSAATNAFCYTVACQLQRDGQGPVGVLGADIAFHK
jgi:hypothetical protein